MFVRDARVPKKRHSARHRDKNLPEIQCMWNEAMKEIRGESELIHHRQEEETKATRRVRVEAAGLGVHDHNDLGEAEEEEGEGEEEPCNNLQMSQLQHQQQGNDGKPPPIPYIHNIPEK